MTDRGYARISLDTQASGSIDKQIARIKQFAGGQIEWYKDESVSGSKVPFADRPSGGRLMADLQKGDRVLVTKIDRAARSVKDLLGLVERIEKAGASIVFVDQHIDTSGPMGRFLLTLLAAIAELEASIIAERRRESLEQFAVEGRHAVGAAPFGFESVPNPGGRGLVIRPHPVNGPKVLDAITMVLANFKPHNKIADDLGIGTTHFARLIRNPRLAGMTPNNGGVVMIDGVPRVDKEAALISVAEFDMLQRCLDKDKGWTKHEGIGPALTCSVCGDRMYFQASKRNPDYATYKCRGKKHEPGQGTASVIAKNAEEHVEHLFLEKVGHQPHMEVIVEDDDAARREAIAVARIALDEIRRKQDNATTEEEEDALEEDARRARKALREAKALPSTSRVVSVPTGRTLAQEWENADPDQKVTMLRLAGEFIVKPGRLPIEDKVSMREVVNIDMNKIMESLTPLS